VTLMIVQIRSMIVYVFMIVAVCVFAAGTEARCVRVHVRADVMAVLVIFLHFFATLRFK